MDKSFQCSVFPWVQRRTLTTTAATTVTWLRDWAYSELLRTDLSSPQPLMIKATEDEFKHEAASPKIPASNVFAEAAGSQ